MAPVKPADIGFLQYLVDDQIRKEGEFSSFMVRAGLLSDMLAELYDHRKFRNTQQGA